MSCFWKKKTIVTYVLSVFVFLIHISSFSNYPDSGGFVSQLNNYASIFFKRVITQHSVTIFFIISGVLFFRNYNNSMYIGKLKSRIKTLLIPFLIWNIIWTLFEIITSYSFLSAYFIGRDRFVVNFANIMNAIFHYGCNGPFWFVFELMFFVLITPVLDALTKNKYMGMLATLVLYVLAKLDIGLPSPLFYSKEAISYYLLGTIIGKYYFEWFIEKKDIKTQIFSIVSLIFCTGLKYITILWGYKLPLLLDGLVLVLYVFSFWYAFDILVDKIRERDFYSNSFAVFAMHINISAVISKICYIVFPKSNWFAMPNFIITFIGTLVIINVFCLLMRRFSPKLQTVLMGSR